MGTRQSALRDLNTIKDFIRWSYSRLRKSDLFYGHGTDNEWDEAVQLVLGGLGLPPDFDKAFIDSALTIDEKKHLLTLLHKRITKRVPLPYLLGEAWFMGLSFKVTSDTLIPRSPIISLLETEFQPWLVEYPHTILDMCTGSGCLGIAAAHVFEHAHVDVSDISDKALEVAKENVLRHELDERIEVIHSDMFEALQGRKYDLIICNPPYVDQTDYETAPAEFKHEPEIALTSGFDGLDFTRRFLKQVTHYLSDNGIVVYEVGNTEVALQEAFPDVPFIWIELEQGGNGVFIISKQELLTHSF